MKKGNIRKNYIGEVLIENDAILEKGFDSVRKILVSNYDYLDFKKFTQDDIQEEHDEYIKIFDLWHLKSNIFYYDDVYEGLRNNILKLESGKNVKKIKIFRKKNY